MTPEKILSEAGQLRETIVSYRRYLHSHPGVGFDIKESVEFVKDKLAAMGYEPAYCGKAGVTATVGGKRAGKVFLLRADMDALQIKEEADVDFASDNGRMHACGHDMHAAMLLGAAQLLKEHEDELDGTVKLMFQPAEEIFEGSHDMIESGVLKDPDVDKAMMIHVMAGVPFKTGSVIVSSPGVGAPGADIFEIKIQGKGTHGSMPNMGIDPLNAAAHILIALQEITARELAQNEQAVLTVGSLCAGEAANVIPDVAVMKGSIRTYDENVRSFVKERLIQIAENTAQAFRTTAEVSFPSGCPALVNDAELCSDMLRYVSELLGKERTYSVADLAAMGAAGSAGSEDFAYVSREVPSVMLTLAAGQSDRGYAYPQHHPMVKFDEDALASGSAVFAYAAMRWLSENSER